MRTLGPWLVTALLLLGQPAQAQPAEGRAAPSAVEDRPEPFARWNRLAFNVTFGFGSASLGRVHDMADAYLKTITSQLHQTADGSLKSTIQINAELGLRYYAPYYVMAQVGYGAIYNWAEARVGGVTVKNWNLLMEVPILVGGYYTFIDRIYVHAAIGPSIFFYPRVWWDAEPGGIPDFLADAGAGMQVLLGADFMMAEHFSLGLELIYRYLKTGDLKEKESKTVALDPAREPYNLDFSGISLALRMRFWAM